MTADADNRSLPTVAAWLRSRMPHCSVSEGAIAYLAFVRVDVGLLSGKASYKERDAVLHEWFDAFPNAYLTPPDSPDWRPVTAAEMSDSSLNLDEGSWVLLMRANDDHALPPRLERPGRTHEEIDRLRRDINGAVFVIAWEDDIEWTVCADPKSLASIA